MLGTRKTGLSPQYFYTDRSKAVLLLWFLTVTCSCCPYLYFASAIMLVTYFVNFRLLNDHLFGKELFIRFTASAFRKLSSVYVFSNFPFGFEGRMLDLIVSVPDHCLSFFFGTYISIWSTCIVITVTCWHKSWFYWQQTNIHRRTMDSIIKEKFSKFGVLAPKINPFQS